MRRGGCSGARHARMARRVARARGLPEAQVHDLIGAHTEPPTLGFLDAPRVHVRRLKRVLAELRPAL